jgi:hypothetical protein
MKRSSLQKRVSKFTPKKFYEIEPWCQHYKTLILCLQNKQECLSVGYATLMFYEKNLLGASKLIFSYCQRRKKLIITMMP